MLAIDDRTSRDWAREMRGTASMASAVTPAFVSWVTRSGFRAGEMREARIAPGRSIAISASVGALILSTMSLPHAPAASTTAAPAAAYASSAKAARSPAPCSTATS